MFLIFLLLLSCKSAEKQRLEPVFEYKKITAEGEYNRPVYDSGDFEYAKAAIESFAKNLGYKNGVVSKEEPLKSLKKLSLMNGSSDTYFSSMKDLQIIKNSLRGTDLGFQFYKNYYLMPFVTVGDKTISFPKNLVETYNREWGDDQWKYHERFTKIYAYNMTAKEHVEILKLDDIYLGHYHPYIKVFEDNSGHMVYLFLSNKKDLDETPLTVKTFFISPKIFFQKSDIYLNRNHIMCKYSDKEVNSIYTGFGLKIGKTRYYLPLADLVQKAVEQKINKLLDEKFNIADLFLDVYDESPLFAWYKEELFHLMIDAIDIFEHINRKYLEKFRVSDPTDEYEREKILSKSSQIERDNAVAKFNEDVKYIFETLNTVHDGIMAGKKSRTLIKEVLRDKKLDSTTLQLLNKVVIKIEKIFRR